MRVLILNDYHEGGGAEVVVHDSAHALTDAGCEVKIITADRLGLPRTPLAYIDSRPARRALVGSLAEFGPGVVHLHNIYHLFSPGILVTLGRWKRADPARRVVMTLHDFHIVCPNAGLRRFPKDRPAGVDADPDRLGELSYLIGHRWDHRGRAHGLLKLAQHLWNYRLHRRRRVIDAAVSPSRFLLETVRPHLEPEGVGLHHLPSPFTLDAEPPPAAGNPAFRLVFAGRIEPEKGLAPFIDALAGLDASIDAGTPPSELHLVGEGSETDACRASADRVGVPLVLHGRRSRAETLEIIAACDALVLPSVTPENAPLAALEGLALHRPILVSNRGGMRELVEDFGVGTAFDPADPADIRRAVAECRSARVTRAQWARVDALLAERSPPRHAGRLIEIYRTC